MPPSQNPLDSRHPQSPLQKPLPTLDQSPSDLKRAQQESDLEWLVCEVQRLKTRLAKVERMLGNLSGEVC